MRRAMDGNAWFNGSFLSRPSVRMAKQSDYWDIDAILAEEESIPVIFDDATQGLGWVDPSQGADNELAAGTKANLPFWLAKEFFEKEVLNIEYPSAYGPAMRDNFDADSTVVSLGSNPYFYRLGLLLADLTAEAYTEATEIPIALSKIFKSRFELIMDKSQNLQSQDYTNYTKTLDSQEQELFYLGYDAAKDFDRWQARISHRIPRSSMLPEQKRS